MTSVSRSEFAHSGVRLSLPRGGFLDRSHEFRDRHAESLAQHEDRPKAGIPLTTLKVAEGV